MVAAYIETQGFDNYGVATDLAFTSWRLSNWNNAGAGTESISTTPLGGTGKSLVDAEGSQATWLAPYTSQWTTGHRASIVIDGGIPGGQMTGTRLVFYDPLGNVQCSIVFVYPTGAIMIFLGADGATGSGTWNLANLVFTSANNIVPFGTTNHWEVFASVPGLLTDVNGNAATVLVNLNGVEVLSYAGSIYGSGVDNTVSAIEFGTMRYTTRTLDHVYFVDEATSTTSLGDQFVYTGFPSGAGDVTGLQPSPNVPNYQNVDDPSVDYDATYNFASSPAVDLYKQTGLTANSPTLTNVQLKTFARKTTAGNRTLANVIKANNIQVAQPAAGLSETYVEYKSPMSVNPVTGVQFRYSEGLLAQIGIAVG